jgi:hypothetical protein
MGNELPTKKSGRAGIRPPVRSTNADPTNARTRHGMAWKRAQHGARKVHGLGGAGARTSGHWPPALLLGGANAPRPPLGTGHRLKTA